MIVLTNIQWHEDECGAFWSADVVEGEKQIGVTSNFYAIEEGGKRLPKEEQVIYAGYANGQVLL